MSASTPTPDGGNRIDTHAGSPHAPRVATEPASVGPTLSTTAPAVDEWPLLDIAEPGPVPPDPRPLERIPLEVLAASYAGGRDVTGGGSYVLATLPIYERQGYGDRLVGQRDVLCGWTPRHAVAEQMVRLLQRTYPIAESSELPRFEALKAATVQDDDAFILAEESRKVTADGVGRALRDVVQDRLRRLEQRAAAMEAASMSGKPIGVDAIAHWLEQDDTGPTWPTIEEIEAARPASCSIREAPDPIAVIEAAEDALVLLIEVVDAFNHESANWKGLVTAHTRFQTAAAEVLSHFAELSSGDAYDPLHHLRLAAGAAGRSTDDSAYVTRDCANGELADLRIRVLTEWSNAAAGDDRQRDSAGVQPPPSDVAATIAMWTTTQKEQARQLLAENSAPPPGSTAETAPHSDFDDGTELSGVRPEPRAYVVRAYQQYQRACDHAADEQLSPPKAFEIFATLLHDLDTDGELPAQGTWERYVREGKRLLSPSSSSPSPRAGRTGRSIVNQYGSIT